MKEGEEGFASHEDRHEMRNRKETETERESKKDAYANQEEGAAKEQTVL